MLNVEQFITVNFLFFTFTYAGSVAMVMLKNYFGKNLRIFLEVFLFITSMGLSAIMTAALTHSLSEVLITLSYALIICIPYFGFFADYTLSGKYFFINSYLVVFFGTIWSVFFITNLPVSTTTKVLMFSGFPLFIINFPMSFIQIFEQYEVLTHRKWERPRFPSVVPDRSSYPKISLQVPTHAEPPDLVIDTLNMLARADYPNFEVIVIDNNTTDERLWKPVEEHVHRLGNRFKFIHVENLKGAKAGALNYAMPYISPDAEIVGVIDADYKAHVLFLKALVGYFDDPQMGFVQTPHDYLGWENNLYLRMCYWEYELFFRTTMVSLNERNAALTVGTMCLIRKAALIKSGGWAEWCLTEDSELAIRIHALGYKSLYIQTSFGWGLIPETFAGYKKQRFRWTAGPIQELKHHFNILAPWAKQKTALTLSQKLEHFNHGLDRANIGLGVLLTPIGIATVTSMIYHKEIITLPIELWIVSSVMLVSSVLLSFFIYLYIVKASFLDTIGAIIASKSLGHVITTASLQALFKDTFTWQRTNKFKELPLGLGAIAEAKTETIIGILIVFMVFAAFILFPVKGLFLFILIGLIFKSFDYFCATYMAIMSDIELKRSAKIVVPKDFVKNKQ